MAFADHTALGVILGAGLDVDRIPGSDTAAKTVEGGRDLRRAARGAHPLAVGIVVLDLGRSRAAGRLCLFQAAKVVVGKGRGAQGTSLGRDGAVRIDRPRDRVLRRPNGPRLSVLILVVRRLVVGFRDPVDVAQTIRKKLGRDAVNRLRRLEAVGVIGPRFAECVGPDGDALADRQGHEIR